MTKPIETDVNLKKLMKIIYQKEKQVQKYRRQLRERQRNKQILQNQIENHISPEEREVIAKQIYENQQFLSTAGLKINEMETKIINLHNELAEQSERNAELEDQIKQLKVINHERMMQLNTMEVEKQLYERNKSLMSVKIKNHQKEIESFQEENFKLKKMNEIITNERNQLSEQIDLIEAKISHHIHEISKDMRKLGSGIINSKVKIPRIGSSLFLQGRSQRKLKSSLLLESETELKTPQEKSNAIQKVQMLISFMKKWQETLSQNQQELRQKFERQLNEHSIIGISKLIQQSEINERPPEEHLNSSFLQNEQDLLKKLEEQCAKSEPYEIEKEKLIELGEVKQSLKMTKQVNVQLFEELGQKDKELRKLRETLQSFSKDMKKGVLANKN